MILTITLNPAIDKEYLLEEQLSSGYQRALKSRRSPGGSGVNVAWMLRQLGHDVLATGFVAGWGGDELATTLRSHGVTTNFSVVQGELATNVHLVDLKEGGETCILEEGLTVTEAQCERFFKSFERMLRRVSAVAMGTSLPQGLTPAFLTSLARRTQEAGLPLFVNSEGAISVELEELAPFFVNYTPRHLLGHQREVNRDENIAFLRRARDCGISWAVSSCQEEGELFASQDGLWLARLPDGEKVGSTYTFDDALSAGVISAHRRNLKGEALVRFAMACALEDSKHKFKGLRGLDEVRCNCDSILVERLDLS